MKWMTPYASTTPSPIKCLYNNLAVIVPGRDPPSFPIQTEQIPEIQAHLVQEHISLRGEYLCFAFKINLETNLTYPLDILLIPNGDSTLSSIISYSTMVTRVKQAQSTPAVVMLLRISDIVGNPSNYHLSLHLQLRSPDIHSSHQIFFIHLKSYSSPFCHLASLVFPFQSPKGMSGLPTFPKKHSINSYRIISPLEPFQMVLSEPQNIGLSATSMSHYPIHRTFAFL